MKEIAIGAEAKIYDDSGFIVKIRVSKSYRIPFLDNSLRKSRTKREIKILQKLEEISFPSPRVIDSNLKGMSISMTKIPGIQISRMLEKEINSDMFSKIGLLLANLHSNDIIHGDLTTSNIMYSEGHIYFIDFGLGSISKKIEDRAVELHLLKQAIDSTLPNISDGLFDEVIKSYVKNYLAAEDVMERLTKVELRGRYKQKK